MDKVQTETKILHNILEELRLLRAELSLLLPREKLEHYAHPKKIVTSFKKALAKYPLAPSWK